MKEAIKNYWEGEAELYGKHITQELYNDEFKNGWEKILKRVISENQELSALDIGTGPGFFAVLMCGMGVNVTAIDLTNNMIDVAKEIAKDSKAKLNFLTMDSHELDFSDGQFDLLICRNVTWTLDDPIKAYKEWYRVLKPGGKVVIFDANYNLRYFRPEIQEVFEENVKKAKEKGIFNEGHKDIEEGERLARELFLSDKERPQWDLNEMLKIGFSEFYVDTKYNEEILTEKDRLYWGHAPSFMIVATK